MQLRQKWRRVKATSKHDSMHIVVVGERMLQPFYKNLNQEPFQRDYLQVEKSILYKAFDF